MNFAAILFFAYVSIMSVSSSSAWSSNSNYPSRNNYGDGEVNDSRKRTRKAKRQMTFDNVYKGQNVQLSSDLRTATRMRPTQDYGYRGTVLSKSILEDDQVFQIRIDDRINRWSDKGIGIGVIKEKQKGIRAAGSIFWNKKIKGTWAILSWSNSQRGKSNTFKDGNLITKNGYPLSTKHLPVGTLLGVSRRRNGNLHFFLNGVDKGPAFVNVPNGVYAFVEIINYVSKISITN